MVQLNALMGGLFILTVFGIVGTRQVLGTLRVFVLQSLILAASACILGYEYGSVHLFVVAAITLFTKAFLIPFLLYRMLSEEVHARREITQVLNIPTSLLVSAGLVICGYFIVRPLLDTGANVFTRVNLPIGVAAILVSGYAITVRREAVPQLLGILTMENGAFFAAVCIAPNLPLMSELAAAFDVLIIALVLGLLAQRIHKHVGTTLVGKMASLKEE